MKILVLNREYPPIIGGISTMSKNLAEEWVRLGHQVDIVTGCYYKSAPKFETVNGVNIYRVNTFSKEDQTNMVSAISYIFFGLLKALNLQRKNHYDIINTYFAILAGPIGAILSKIFKIRNLLMIISGDIYEPTKKMSPHNNIILRPIVRWVLNNADNVVAPSYNVKMSAEKYYKPNKEIQVIPIGFKIPEFRPKNRLELGLNNDKIYLVSVGRLAPRKNFDSLLKAFSKIKNEKVELILIGDGSLRNELSDLGKKLNISEKVHFVGAVSEENKFQYLSAADIFVLTSVHEGFGIVYQEAMYCGLPIIAGNNGGQTEFLINNKNALLVDPKNSEDIVLAVNKLVSDSSLRSILAQNAKNDVEKFFINKIASDYIKMMQ